MKIPLCCAAAILIIGAGAHARQDAPVKPPETPAAPLPEPKKAPPAIYDEAADAGKQIDDAIARAKKENRRVLVQWGANWCGWCRLLHAKFKDDKEIAKELQYEYDVVLVDVGQFDKHTDLAKKYGADIKAGIPFLTVLDAEGKVLANQETGVLEAKTPEGKNGHDSAKILAFLTKHQAPYLPASQVLEEGLSRARAQSKQVFLHFGAPWCVWCHRLEAWSARPDVAPILAKDFVGVKIDQDRTVGGKDLLRTYDPENDAGIPFLVILSADGKTVVTSDGPAGNIGHPAKDEEIDHFISMMKKSARSMTAADLAALRTTLLDERKKFQR